ncbi:hypothetical protein [Roseomonas fluvialis]|uniref:Uncharacterized protein n=1 Tax=Roseomonas fluvialis TaxID=1750527 RepID=A0ABN6P6V2_9PROT|nr:hypothetical protein [Roseomonas fluvialis]BDG74055.1 hypothetical protein Rmf_39840 [Roseomonas fluvialis]
MTDDSRPRRLALVEAVLAWTPPHLMDAVRDAEDMTHHDELVRWGRDAIATITQPRARPQRGRMMSMAGRPAGIAALDRAWDAVFDHVRLEVEKGTLQLTGRMMRPEHRQNAQPIPSVWGRALDFDLRAGAVFFEDQTFVAVETSKQLSFGAVPEVGSDEPGNRTPGDTCPSAADQDLSLLEAMTQWCEPRLVNRVREEERKFIAIELHRYFMPKLTHETEWSQPTSRSWMAETNYVFLTAAWNELTIDFRRRIERGEMYLRGVLSGDDPAAAIEAIPGFWAAELMFDLRANAVRRDSRTYLAVRVSKQAPAEPPVAKNEVPPAAAEPRGPVTPLTAATLTDEEVFVLLDEYARRVVAEEGSPLRLPVKVSFIPILRRKMRQRFATGEHALTLGAEAAALEEWIKTKVDGHQTPSAGHIENELREEHRRLKAQHPRPASKDRDP